MEGAMCNCASCEYTDSFSGWIFDAEQDKHVPDPSKGGFASWPKGEPKGAVTSAAEYRKHAAHCGANGLPKPYTFKAPDAVNFYAVPAGMTRAQVRAVLRQSFGLEPKPESVSPVPAKPALHLVPASKPASMPDDVAEFVRRRMAA
jgi:hypothetical protein